MSFRNNFLKNTEIYKGIIRFLTDLDKKTLVLDLDETLIMASPNFLQGYHYSFILKNEFNIKTQVRTIS